MDKLTKVELEHFLCSGIFMFISQYLPYGLNDVDSQNNTYLFQGFNDKGDLVWSSIHENKVEVSAKPILRPLSEITREELIKRGFNTHLDYLTVELNDLISKNGL